MRTIALPTLLACSSTAFAQDTDKTTNYVKSQLAQHKSVFGGGVLIGSVENIEALARPGKLDFMWIDAEKTSMGLSQLQPTVITSVPNSNQGSLE